MITKNVFQIIYLFILQKLRNILVVRFPYNMNLTYVLGKALQYERLGRGGSGAGLGEVIKDYINSLVGSVQLTVQRYPHWDNKPRHYQAIFPTTKIFPTSFVGLILFANPTFRNIDFHSVWKHPCFIFPETNTIPN